MRIGIELPIGQFREMSRRKAIRIIRPFVDMAITLFNPAAAARREFRRFQGKLQRAPTVASFEDAISQLLTFRWRQNAKSSRIVLAATAIFGLTLLFAAHKLFEGSHWQFVANGVAVVMMYAFELTLLLFWRRHLSYLNCPYHLFLAAVNLESAPERWSSLEYRIPAARHIEVAAKSLEKGLPARKGISPSARSELARLAQAKSAGLRDLELWLIKPGAFTFTDIIQRLMDDFALATRGDWQDLPDGTSSPVKPFARSRLALFGVGVVAILLMALVIAFSGRIGSAAPYLTTLLGITGVAIFNRAGLSIGDLSSFVDVEKKIIK